MKQLKSYRALLVILIGLVIVFISLFLARNLLPENKQAQYTNIFEEVYRNEISYLQGGGSIKLMGINGFHINTAPDTSDYKAGLVSAAYENKALPANSFIQISSNRRNLRILYRENLDNNIKLYLIEDYNPKTKVLKRNVYIKDNYERHYNDQLANYLTRYQLTKQSIKDKFALIDKTFLADWVKVSDSPYSPTNYGDVKVVDEWKIEE